MRLRKCKMCGKEFEGEKSRRLCPECSEKERKEKIFRQKTCVVCGRVFVGVPTSKYCPECAIDRRRQRQEEYHKRKTAGVTRKIGSTDICPVCRKEYVVKNGLQKYCPDCAEQANLEKKRKTNRERSQTNRDDLTKKRRILKENSAVCVYCGKVFTPTEARATCSPECAEKREQYMQALYAYKVGKTKNPPPPPPRIKKDAPPPD